MQPLTLEVIERNSGWRASALTMALIEKDSSKLHDESYHKLRLGHLAECSFVHRRRVILLGHAKSVLLLHGDVAWELPHQAPERMEILLN